MERVQERSEKAESGYETYYHSVAVSATAKEYISYLFEAGELSMHWEAFYVAIGFRSFVLFP